jgi:hypothetical protein
MMPKTRDVLLGLLSLVSILAGVHAGVSDRVAAAGVLFAAGIVLSLLSNLHRVESFKAFSVEAKLRTLDYKIDEADRLLSQIRGASVLMAEISFQMIARIGRFGGAVPKDEALELSDKLIAQLRSCGATGRQIEECMKPWKRINVWDMSRPLFDAVKHLVDLKQQAFREQSAAIPQPINASNPEYIRITEESRQNGSWLSSFKSIWSEDLSRFVSDFESLVSEMPCASPEERAQLLRELKFRLDTLRHYQEHGEFKDRKAWLAEPYG